VNAILGRGLATGIILIGKVKSEAKCHFSLDISLGISL